MERFLVPIRRRPCFSRDDVLSDVGGVLAAQGCAVIYGEGGTGYVLFFPLEFPQAASNFQESRGASSNSDDKISKTQLALDFCFNYKTVHQDALILWIGAETKPYLEERMKEIAAHLSILDQTNLSGNIANWLQRHSHDEWILVLDDVGQDFQRQSDGADAKVSSSSSTVIFRSLKENMTTLEENLTHALRSKNAEVVVSNPTLSESLQILKLHCSNVLWDASIAEQIVTNLEFSPLAISIATAYMEEGELTLSEFLNAFRYCEPDYTHSSFYNPIGRTLILCLRRLEAERPHALSICKLMAVLDRQSVVESLLSYDHKRYNARNLYGSLRKLDSLSLVHKIVGDYHYSMHRLVRDFFLEHLKNEGKLEEQQQSATELLSRRYPYGDQTLWTVCRIYNPHAHKIVKHEGPDVWPRVALLRSMASYHQKLGNFETACTLYMELREIYASKKPLSAKQNDMMVDISLRAVQMLGKMSQFDAGEELLRDTMGDIESELEPEPGRPQLIHARSLQAWFCSWQGQYAESERLWRLCLKENNAIYYETHVDSLIYESNITTALINQEKYAEAELLLTQNLKHRISIRGNEHPDTIQTQQILAGAYQKQGKFAKAEELNQKLLEIANRVQGPEHPDTLVIINNLAINLTALGRFSEAEAMQRRLLASNERQFGSEHEQVMLSRLNLAVTLEKLGKYATAEEQNKLALAAHKKLFPSDTHPTRMNIENSLGLVLLRQEKYEQAEPILRDILRKRQETLGLDHQGTLISQNNLGGLLMKQKKYAESITVLRDTLKAARSKLSGEENAFTLRLMNSLSEVMRQGIVEIVETERKPIFQEALELQRNALAGRVRLFGEDHPDVFTSQSNLAHLLHDMDECTEARQLYEKAFTGLRRRLGENHPVTRECKENFSACTGVERADISGI
jgi:tetratricopeptide (TPR) repeat protein